MVLKKIGTLVILGAMAGAARADLTYTTKITVSSGGQGGEAKVYQKGNSVRTEAANSVTINDGTRTYLINTEKKTYSVVANKKLESPASNPMMEQFTQMIDLKMDVSVKPGGKTKTILGQPAKNYLFTMTMRMNFKPGSGPKSADGKAPMRLPVIQSQGETWTTDALPTPPAGSGSFGPSAMFRAMGMLSASAKSATSAFDKIKGFPLETTMTQKASGANLPGADKGPRNLTLKMSVVNLKTDPVDAALFAPPKGFKQVPYEPPTLPGMSGMGGGM